jgi:voltage-gated potassium channel
MLRRGQQDFDRWVARTDGPLLGLAVAFVVVLAVPYVGDLSPAGRLALTAANVVIWLVFAIDYLARLYLAPDRRFFVRNNLIDLAIVVVPFLRPLRALRLLRLLRLAAVGGVLFRRSSSLHARVSAYVTSATVVALILSALAMYDAERDAPDGNIHSFADALWWAATTVTTVGYGDRYPTTETGRLIAAALMLVGIALLGVVTASVAAWFVNRLRPVQEAEEAQSDTLREVLSELRRLHERLDALDRRTAP